MSNLLEVLRFQPKALQKKGAQPLVVEVPVSPDTAPYLASSSTSYMWIEEPHPGNIVKAAVRKIKTPGRVFKDVLELVEARGSRDEWGNVHPFTEEGVWAAIHHLEYYGIEDIEILVPSVRVKKKGSKAYKRPKWLDKEDAFNVPMRPSSWLPDNTVLALPVDRNFVGTLGHVDPTTVIMVLHNASRGIGIARGRKVTDPVQHEARAE